MKCPVCSREGLRSTVYGSQFSTTTDMGWQPYWDEDGVFHDHNPNGHGRSFTCSRRHSWSVGSVEACPAGDYPSSSKLTIHEDLPKPAPMHVWSQDPDGKWTSHLTSDD